MKLLLTDNNDVATCLSGEEMRFVHIVLLRNICTLQMAFHIGVHRNHLLESECSQSNASYVSHVSGASA